MPNLEAIARDNMHVPFPGSITCAICRKQVDAYSTYVDPDTGKRMVTYFCHGKQETREAT